MWKKGDFGRFQSESPKLPRFEVLGVSEKNVQVWYGGESQPMNIPKDTFRKDCVNWWELAAPIPPIPTWLKEGVLFELDPTQYVQAHVPELRGIAVCALPDPGREYRNFKDRSHAVVSHTERGSTLVRRIRRDYVSLLMGDKLMLLPIKVVIRCGRVVSTVWSRLVSDEDIFELNPSKSSLEDEWAKALSDEP